MRIVTMPRLAGVAALVVSMAATACTRPAPSPTAPTTTAPTTTAPSEGALGTVAENRELAAFTIMPPGNGNFTGATRSAINDQTAMYDSVETAVARGPLDDSDLSTYFKSEPLGGPQPEQIRRTERPRSGVRVDWDHFDVPHVKGATAGDVAYGAGWVMAEARFVILVLARELGRSGLLEQVSADSLVDALGSLATAPLVSYSEEELQASIDEAIEEAGADGPAILAAIEDYCAGINAWMAANPTFGPDLAKLGLTWPEPFRPTDVVAAGIVVNNIFGAGGGDEVGNLRALQALEGRFGAAAGRAVFDDLRMIDDPEATPHVDDRFPYPLFRNSPTEEVQPGGADDPSSIADLDPDSAALLPGIEAATVPHASNSVVLDAQRTASGHPVMVGGPQSAYVAPQLLFEWELSGGGYDASGITFPGIGPFVVIGHSRNYAWTATSGDSDVTDQRIERLCNPDGSPPTDTSRAYMFNGVCTPMTRPPGFTRNTMWRTVHGPVTGYATVDGAPVAISRQRASFLMEPHAALAFWQLSRGEVTDANDFASVMSSIPMSFNWSYINDKDVAYFHSGYYPVRTTGSSFDFPTWGTGEWEWQGLLGRDDVTHNPQGVNPQGGQLASWNSKPAPGWSNADNKWGVGSVQRVDLLVDRIEGLRDASVADVVTAVQQAATSDLRAVGPIDEMLRVIENTAAPNSQLETTRRLLEDYVDSGANRRDVNGDWLYDNPVTGVADALYPALVHAVFDEALGSEYMADVGGPRRPAELDNAPSMTGSAFNSPTWYSITTRELQRARGAAERPAGVPAMCGGGSLQRCQDALWDALASAYNTVRSQQLAWNKGNVASFRTWTGAERIRFLPFITNAHSMRWQNRPTFQQVMSFR